jgi:hypothetical protein
LNVSHHEVLARCISVWMVCYERREAVIPREDIEIAAELDGFTTALVESDLADLVSESDVYVRGVTERIAFLEQQSARGKKSGEARRELSAKLQKRTSVQQTFDLPLNGKSNHRSTSLGSTGNRTNSLAPDHALDLDLEITDLPGERERGAALESSDPIVGDGTAQTANVEPSAAGEAERKTKARIPAPPSGEAFTEAHYLLASVIANHPESRLAKMSEKVAETTAYQWAGVFDRMHKIDRHAWTTIHSLVVWTQRHHYWQTVVIGADVLRAKWDKIIAESKRDRIVGPRADQRPGPTAQSVATLEALEAEQGDKKGNPDDGT